MSVPQQHEQWFTLLLGPESWRLARVRAEEVEVHDLDAGVDASLEVRAASVARMLQEFGHDGGDIALCVPSARCLCAAFATDDLERAGRRQAL
ncbi:MAG: hypothetical protein ACOC1G_08625, partial [Phycisphaeraceae bacterium]